MTVSPQLRQLAERLRVQQGPAHRSYAQTVLAYERLLTEGERWFLNSILRLSSLSDRQWERLHLIAADVERKR